MVYIKSTIAKNNKSSHFKRKQKEIVFIDPGIDDYQTLINGINAGVEIHILDSQQDGVLQISSILQQHTKLDAIHIISHGNIGYLSLGNSVLSTDTLNKHEHSLSLWKTGLKQNADILIYGCNVAKGITGRHFIQQLAELTDTNIAASTSVIGNVAQNSNWELTAKVGDSTSPIIFNQKAITKYQGTLITEIENFNIEPAAFSGGATPGSFSLNGFTYTFSGSGSGGHFDWGSNNGSGITGGIILDSNFAILPLLLPETFTITRTDSSPFVFNSIDVSALVNILTFKGKLAGNTIATTLTVNLLGFQSVTFAGGATIVDSIEVSALVFDDLADAIDNFSYDLDTNPNISAATYDYNTNVLVVTGNNFVAQPGAANDVDVSLLTFTGEGDATYTLTDSADVEIDSATQFTVALSGADIYNVEALLNKDGVAADNGTTFNLAAADNWMTGAPPLTDIADATNGITISNVVAPAVTSTTFDISTGVLLITGTNFVNKSGAANDLDASRLTFTGEDGATYILTDTSDVDITSATSATVTLSSTDQLNIQGLLNKAGTTSGNGITYNIALADNWLTGSPAATDIADLAGNGISVSNVQTPTITSSTYDSSTGILVVTGTNLFKKAGATNDVDISTLTLTGGTANTTYSITSTSDVEITSATSFSVTLTGADKTSVDALLDQAGTTSLGGSDYKLAVADNWLAGADVATNIADADNVVTVSISVNPQITSTTYDANTGTVVVTGTNIQANAGAFDIDASTLTFTGEGGETYTLTDSADVERDSATQFTVSLSATDKAALNQIFNKSGSTSTSTTNYNLAVADDWNTSVTADDTADATGNTITVSNVAVPTITSIAYDASAGTLVVTGTGFLKLAGATNDIDTSKFTFTGEGGGGAAYTLTDSADVEITSGTEFTVTLSATDKAAVNLVINKAGTAAIDATTYNLAAAEDWAAGADAAVNVIDATGNGITATITTPSSGVGATFAFIDGITVRTIVESNGTVTLTTPIVDDSRQDDPSTMFSDHADIPVTSNSAGDTTLTISIPVGVGLSTNAQPQAMSKVEMASDWIHRINNIIEAGSEQRAEIAGKGQSFIDSLTADELISVRTVVPTVNNKEIPSNIPIIMTGSAQVNDGKQALVIEATKLFPDTILQLDHVDFATIIGAARVTGGEGENITVIGDNLSQIMMLDVNDAVLFGGGGDDTIGSLGGYDQISGDAGNDIVYGGSGNDIISGGAGDDQLNGGFGFDIAVQEGQQTDYQVTIQGDHIILTHSDGTTDIITDVELVRFTTGPTIAVAHSATEAAAHHLAKTWLGRDLT